MRIHPLVLAGLAVAVLSDAPTLAQGRCIRAYGTPACNTDPIAPPFARTGWRTVGLDHITWRVADPGSEAAFYAALMGWRVRSSDATRVVMDMSDWGTAIFRKAPADAFTGRVRAVVEGLGFAIDPWNARDVERALRERGLSPIADRDGGGESFHVKDPDGFDIQISNGRGIAAARGRATASASAGAPAPFAATDWRTVWLDHLSFNVSNYKASALFYTNLLGWAPTYDEGSQNELMIGDVGDVIVRGGNPLDPAFGPKSPRAGTIDHISFGIAPWDTDGVRGALEQRGLTVRVDTSDGSEIHVAQYKSYHTTTPNGFDLQISYNTHDTRLNLALAVNPRRPGVR